LLDKVPFVDTGGFVQETGLAVIHQGEQVVPAGQSGGGDIIIEQVSVPGARSKAEARMNAEAVADEFEKTIGRRGG
jgi:hypothetical protein